MFSPSCVRIDDIEKIIRVWVERQKEDETDDRTSFNNDVGIMQKNCIWLNFLGLLFFSRTSMSESRKAEAFVASLS